MRRISRLVKKAIQHPANVFRSVVFKTSAALFPDRLLVPKLKHSSAKMWVTARDPGLSQQLYVWGWREEAETQLVRSCLKEGQVVVDIGANLGFYVLIEAQLVGKSGKIIAIEPSPKNVELLQKNVSANNFDDRVKIVHAAISGSSGVGKLYLTKHFNLNAMSAGRLAKFTEVLGSVDVETYRLDDLLLHQGVAKESINFIRMDVEGHEVDVIRGMAGVLQAAGNLAMLMEVHPELIMEKYGQAGYFEMLENLETSGMRICKVGICKTCRESVESDSLKTYQQLRSLNEVYYVYLSK